MIIKQAYWEIGKELKWKEYGKKKIARYNKKLTELEIELMTDFDIEGWTLEGRFIPPSVKITRRFTPVSAIIEGGKVTIPLENKVSDEMGKWEFELVLKGLDGEQYTSNNKLGYEVPETVAAQSLNELLNAEDSDTVDSAREGLEGATREATTKESELDASVILAEDKRVEVAKATNDANTTKTELEATTQAVEIKDTELKASIEAGEAKKQEITGEGEYQYNRIKNSTDGLEKRVDDVEEILISDTIRVGLYDPNQGLPPIVSKYGNQYWEASESGLLNIPGVGDTEVEEYSKLYWIDGTRWEYISARSDLLPKGEGLEAKTARELELEIKEQSEQIQNLSEYESYVLDATGKPSLMVRIPKFFLDDVLDGAEHVIHPAFVVNGEIKDEIYISKYQNTVIDEKAYSLPGKDPKVYTNFDQARGYCEAKGQGWHLMTNAEWSAIALWCKKMGLEPQGNNYAGVSYSNKLLGGVESYAWKLDYNWSNRSYKEDPVGTYWHTGRTFTGTSPVEFSHNGNSAGIFDLNGNVWEWVGGMRLVDGEIHIIENNNASITGIDQSSTSAEWKAILQDGSLVAPGTSDTLKYDNTSGVPKLNVLSTQAYKNIALKDLVAEEGIVIPELLKTLCLMPSGNTGGDRAYINTEGERFPLRGGRWQDSSAAGVFSLILNNSRGISYYDFGFRSAFVL